MLNFHDPGCMTPLRFALDYEMPLARAFYNISQRGILTDGPALADLRLYINSEIKTCLNNISKMLGDRPVVEQIPTINNKKIKLPDGTINLASPDQVIDILQSFGIQVPKKRRQKSDGSYHSTETTDEEALNTLFATTGHPFLRDQLRIRELTKIRSTYVDAELEAGVLYSAYFVTGTVTGRRSSRENFLGLGNNGQNQPKHSDLGKKYRRCMVARPGRIFVSCDQVQAEDWIVSGIIADQSGDRTGLDELIHKIDRHAKLASFIFSKPLSQVGKGTPERFMGKKVRHAGNYDVYANELSSAFSKEAFQVPPSTCEWLLQRFHAANPGIRGTYHKYIQDQLTATGTLTTPFGRTRQFFGLRSYSDNKKIYKEAYAQDPQSTVGDNTGMAVLWLESNHPGYVVADGHDSVTLEVEDDIGHVTEAVHWLQTAFDRRISFPNGLHISIPIEIELGYNLQDVSTCDDLTDHGLITTYQKLPRPANHQNDTTCGVPSPSLAAH